MLWIIYTGIKPPIHSHLHNTPDFQPPPGSSTYLPRLETEPAHVDWCKCQQCRPMPQEIENKCCRQRNCVTLTNRFCELCVDPDVLELCVKNRGDIRNDRDDNSTRSFRKAAYREYILHRCERLGKGHRRVAPSCVVLNIRQQYPSTTGIYMGYRER